MNNKNYLFFTASLSIHLSLALVVFHALTAHKAKIFFAPIKVTLVGSATPKTSSLAIERINDALHYESVETTEDIPRPAVGVAYLPVSQLDVKPQVVKDIDPNLLENFHGVQAQWLNILLLINEYGDVDQVIVDHTQHTSDLPDLLVDNLKQRFLEARFLPGRLDNQSVRSQMRIRIRLE